MATKLKIIYLIFVTFVYANVFAQSPNYFSSGNFATPNSFTQSNATLMSTSAGGSFIHTTTSPATGNRYFRFFSATSGGTTYEPNGATDILLTSSASSSLQITGSGKAYYLNIANSASNVVFKTAGSGAPGTSQIVAFEIQGAVRSVSSVAQSPTISVAAGQTVAINTTLDGALFAGQAVYLRYTNDAFATSTVVPMIGSGNVYSSIIPSSINTSGSTVRYYVFTSGTANVAQNGLNADLFTINLNNNGGINYSYTVTTATSNVAPLGNSPYTQNFDNIGNGIPLNTASGTLFNWNCHSTATSTTVGTVTTFVTATTSWGTSVGQFNNAASSNTPSSSGDAATPTQSGRIDRAFALTQTVSFANPGSAFSYQLPNTTGLLSFNLAFKLMQLDPGAAGKTTTWNVQYGFGASPTSWTNATTSPSTLTTTAGTWGSTNVSVNFGTTLDNNSGPVWIRIVSLAAATGSGSSPVTAIDDWNLSWSLPVAPTVTSFAVAAPGSSFSGYVGNLITVTGTGFLGVTSVKVGGSGGTTVSSFTVVNSTTITFPAINASGAVFVSNSAGNATSGTSYTNLGYITQTGATDWATPASWLGSAIPPTGVGTTIAHDLTVSAATPNAPSTITVNSGVILNVNNAAASITASTSIANNGTVTFSNTGSITTPLFSNTSIGTLSWSAAGTLNISANGTLTNNGTFTRGTGTVNFLGIGTINGSNTITFNNLTMNTGALSLITGPTIDGVFTINGGNVNNANNAPIYTANSTLQYNATYSRFFEWSANGVGTIGTTAGYPNNVTINSGTFTVVNVDSGTARAMNGNLLVNAGATFTTGGLNANFTIGGNLTTSGTGAINMSNSTNRMTVNGNINIVATSSLALSTVTGGDLYVNGNLSNNGTFTHNTRAVFFSGTSLQTILGNFITPGATNNLPFVFISNSNGVTLASNLLINNNITLTSGKFILSTFNLTMASGATISSPTASNYIQTSSTGRLIQSVGAGNVFYPVGKSTYNPITLNNNGGTIDNYGIYVLDAVATPAPNDATKLVNRFWNINEEVAGGNDLAITTQWNSPSEENANFAAATIARIGFYVSSWTTQLATAGAGTLGAGSVTFASNIDFTPSDITAGATISAGKDDSFVPIPVISNFAPTSAYTGGTIVITGTNFSSITSVTIGGVAASSFTINNITQITATVAAGASGSVVITSGTGSGSLAGFTYLGYITNVDGSWSAGATWLGNSVPPNNSIITINHAVNLVGSNPTQTTIIVNATKSLNINGNGNLIATSSVTNNGMVAFSSTGTITTPTFTNNGTLAWTGSSSTLNIGNNGILTNNGTFTRGTGIVNFVGIGTISGTISFNNLTVNGSLDIGSNTTINGNLTLNASSFINTGIPIYANTATLVYNSGGTYSRGNEWTGASSGAGFPNNIIISSVGTIFNMNAGTAFCGGNITIDPSTTFNSAIVALNVTGNVTINGTMSLVGDINIKGNWTVAAAGVQTNNGKAVSFNAASGNQTISKTGGGTVFFDYLIIDKTAGNVILSSLPSTDITINSTSGDVLQLNNAGALELSGRTLTLNNDNGNIAVNGTNRSITSTVANASIIINGDKTVTGVGNLVLAANVNLFLNKGFNCGTGNKTTINGTLQINLGGFVTINAPIYGSTSLLKYNSNTTFNRDIEWNRNIGASFGVPNNVQISNNTTLNYPYRLTGNPAPGPLGIAGSLTIDSGSSLYMNFGNVSSGGELTILGNLTNSGNLTLGFSTGDDLRIAGDLFFNTGYTFDAKNRAIFFTKNGVQTISGTGGTPTFHYVLLTPSSGTTTVRLSGMNLNITAPNGGNSLDFGAAANVFDINGGTLTLGTAGKTNTITGANGTFSGSLTSNLTLLGNSSIGVLKFATGFQTLGTLTINKVSGAVGATLGTNLDINTALVLTSGLIDLTGFNMTLSAAATITSTSTNFVISDGSGELRKTFTTTGAFTYPIGDSSFDYTPATLTFSSGTFASAYVGLKVTDAKHPNNIATTDFLTRYWSVTSSGITSPIYNFTGTYISGSADISGTEANSKPGRWDGIDWIDESATSISANTLTLTGLNSLSTINQFTAGSPLTDANYYYRSNVSNGLWNSASSWQSSADGSTNWSTAMTPPSNRAAGILVRNGFNINADATRTADDLTIEASATLTISSGTFTLNNGTASTDLTVNGTLTYSGGTLTQNASSGIIFAANATYNHTAATASLTLPIAAWNISSNCNVTGLNNSAAITGGSTVGQTFGNFTFDNTNQTNFLNIENNNFRVNGTLTIGPNATNQKISFTNSGTNSNTINRIVVSKGQLSVANSGNETLSVTNDVVVTDGFFIVSTGSGTANVDIGTDLSISGNGTVQVLGAVSSPSQTLRIHRDLLISGIDPQLNLEAVNTTSGIATVTVDRDFTCTSSGTIYSAVEFGTGTSGGSAAGNVINIGRNFVKSGNGSFFTTSNTSATGFAFNGTGTQTFSYSGNNSNFTSYVIRNNATLLLNSNLTLGTGTNPASSFTIDSGGTLNFQTNSIIAGNTTDPRFITSAASNIITSNTNGLGGTSATGSICSFGSVLDTTAAGRATFVTGTNYTFNGNTTTPFPNGTFGNPATINVNAVIISNMTSNLSVTTAINVNNNGSFTLNPTNNNSLNLNGASLNINTGGSFDNGGENQIFNGSGTPAINISGTFITRDVQGFVGTNTSIPTIVPILNSGSTVEYGLAGNQQVQGSTAPTYQNITFSNGGTKTLVSLNPVVGTISILGTTIFDAGNNAFGSGTSNVTMTGTSKYMLGGTTATKPESGGIYNLGVNTTFEFTGSSATNIRLAAPNISYPNIIISGTNVSHNGIVEGLKFATGGTFTVKNGGVFKIKNTAGFTGSSSTGIDTTTNGGPTITLETGSRIEFAGNQILPATQTVTPFPTYSDVGISGTGTKTLANTTEVYVGRDLLLLPEPTTASTGFLQIDNNRLLTVERNILNTSTKDLIIKNGGNLVQVANVDNATTNANVGNIKMTRNSRSMIENDYVYWGSPVMENVYSQIPAIYGNTYMWNLICPSGSIDGYWENNLITEPGRGFITRVDNGGDGIQGFNFVGTPNNGTVKVHACNYDSSSMVTGNTILLANPYPSAIDCADFLTNTANVNKLGGTLYFWTSSTPFDYATNSYTTDDYSSWNLTGAVGTSPISNPDATSLLPNGKIAAGQGFFAQVFDNFDVTFKNTMRQRNVTSNSQFFKHNIIEAENNQKHRIWLNLFNDNNEFRQMLVGYLPQATNNYERLYDGDTFTNNNINIYSIVENKSLVIQGRALPFQDSDLVPLGIKITNSGNYSIAIDHTDGLFLGNQNIYLEDLLLNVIHDLKASSYSFFSESGSFNNRFVIRYTNETLSTPTIISENAVFVYKEKNALKINSSAQNIENVSVYDVLGRTVFERFNINSKNFTNENLFLNKQTLIVKIKLYDGSIISKKIIF